MEKNLPLNYALFTNKQLTTYTKFFKFIKEKITIEPLSVSCGFELAFINSVVDVFPEASVDGCSIWKYIQGNGLATKILACLAFVPVEHVVTGFVNLQECAPVELKNLYSYFEENYIGAKKRTKVPSCKDPRFEHELWNCYDRTFKRKQPVIRIKLAGIDHHYIGSQANPNITKAIVDQWITAHKDFQYTDFDAISLEIEEASVHCLQLVEDDYLRGKCSCLAFAKHHLCKHILAVSAQLKLADCVISLIAKQIPIGQRRWPGRPKNAKRALIKQ
ncbi:hypothetical protein BpHYR1_007860 [Brachionus plicatilis]|uniref:SWIM-type domain-containing protein n=1 Tax=Brachionus plicatilis TaxID=10195 RepID=A0A3M7STI8_BRAPC|nr:hypothetical protein BpHYR1_007860 [Brachionus plicatilis]